MQDRIKIDTEAEFLMATQDSALVKFILIPTDKSKESEASAEPKGQKRKAAKVLSHPCECNPLWATINA